MNAARVRLNAKIASLAATGGQILDTTAFSQQCVNNGWRRMQNKLQDQGLEQYQEQVDIFNIPIVTNMDPASECQISQFQFFDGTNYQTTPILPADFVTPLWICERPSNTNFVFPDVNRPNMRCMTDGLQSAPKYNFNRQWTWRRGIIYFPGALVAVDFRIFYRSRYMDFANVGTTRWWDIAVPIIDCQDAFAWWIAAEYAAARAADGDSAEGMLAVASACLEMAEAATKLIANRDAMKNQRVNNRRIPYGQAWRSGNYGGYGFRG
jgi:hypothetical protein